MRDTLLSRNMISDNKTLSMKQQIQNSVPECTSQIHPTEMMKLLILNRINKFSFPH